MRLGDYIVIAHANDTKVVNKKMKRHGLAITIEHPKGSVRVLHDDKGRPVYQKLMHSDYGYFNKTKGRDGDEVDCLVGPIQNAKEVFIVHMKDMGPVKSEREDEDKCMVGYQSADAAKAAFLAHYPATFYDGMTALPVAVFKKRLKTAQLPHMKKKLTARQGDITCTNTRKTYLSTGLLATATCPKCGSKKYSLKPTDFETAECAKCGKQFQVSWGKGLRTHKNA